MAEQQTKVVKLDGKTYRVPADATYDEIDALISGADTKPVQPTPDQAQAKPSVNLGFASVDRFPDEAKTTDPKDIASGVMTGLNVGAGLATGGMAPAARYGIPAAVSAATRLAGDASEDMTPSQRAWNAAKSAAGSVVGQAIPAFGARMMSAGSNMLARGLKLTKAVASKVKGEAGEAIPIQDAGKTLANRMLSSGIGFSRRGYGKVEKIIDEAEGQRAAAIKAADAAGARVDVRKAASAANEAKRLAQSDPTDYAEEMARVRRVRDAAIQHPYAKIENPTKLTVAAHSGSKDRATSMTPTGEWVTRPGGARISEDDAMAAMAAGTPDVKAVVRPYSPLKMRQVPNPRFSSTMPVGKAQQVRTRTNQLLKEDWGKLSSAQREAQKGLATGLGAEIEKATGGQSLKANQTMQRMIPVERALQDALTRTGNHNAISLYDAMAAGTGMKGLLLSALSKRAGINAASQGLWKTGRAVSDDAMRAAVLSALMSSHGGRQ